MIKIFLIIFMSVPIWASIGSIMVVKGEAKVKRDKNSFDAVSAMDIFKGDTIVTSKRSRVQVMLKDDTVVTIGSKSSFSFEDFDFDGTKKSKIKMKSNRGFFRSVTGKIGKVAPERFKVKTASATIGIRGTDFTGNDAGGVSTFKCYSGGISVEFDGGSRDVGAGMVMTMSGKRVVVKEIKTVKAKESSKKEKKKEEKKKEEKKQESKEKKEETKDKEKSKEEPKQSQEKSKESDSKSEKSENKKAVTSAPAPALAQAQAPTQENEPAQEPREMEEVSAEPESAGMEETPESMDEMMEESFDQEIESVEIKVEDIADVTLDTQVDKIFTELEETAEILERTILESEITPGTEDR